MAKLLITGGTGSFGTAVLERFLNKKTFDEIIIFSRDECKQHEMRQRFISSKIKFVIGDTRDRDSVSRVMVGVDVVFHAAAFKHVPAGEFFPLELVKTNILGTENVFAEAHSAGVKTVVFLSTDKAVYPVNAMGMTKALAEKIMTSYSRLEKTSTVFCAVRYGNVMASRGSVIPLFIGQIKSGKDITVTNPTMTRFMLSLDDAIDLVEFAISKSKTGDIFVKKAPSATVAQIAQALITIFKSKSKIKIIGVRKGEKLHETLANSVELADSEDYDGFIKLRTRSGLDYDKYLKEGARVNPVADYTSENTTRLNQKEVEGLLLKLPLVKESLK